MRGHYSIRRHIARGLVLTALLAACNGDDGSDRTPSPPAAPTEAAAPVTPSPTVAPREAMMRLQEPTPTRPIAGQMFTIPVLILDAANLAAYQFSPVYDSAIMELVSTQNGGFLASTGRSPTCSTEARPGARVTFYCVTLGAEPAGPSGDGTLAVLQFRALTPGTTSMTLEGATASMPDARDLPVTVEPITVTVAP